MKQWNIIFFTIWLSDEMFLAKIENYKKKKKKIEMSKTLFVWFLAGFHVNTPNADVRVDSVWVQ